MEFILKELRDKQKQKLFLENGGWEMLEHHVLMYSANRNAKLLKAVLQFFLEMGRGTVKQMLEKAGRHTWLVVLLKGILEEGEETAAEEGWQEIRKVCGRVLNTWGDLMGWNARQEEDEGEVVDPEVVEVIPPLIDGVYVDMGEGSEEVNIPKELEIEEAHVAKTAEPVWVVGKSGKLKKRWRRTREEMRQKKERMKGQEKALRLAIQQGKKVMEERMLCKNLNNIQPVGVSLFKARRRTQDVTSDNAARDDNNGCVSAGEAGSSFESQQSTESTSVVTARRREVNVKISRVSRASGLVKSIEEAPPLKQVTRAALATPRKVPLLKRSTNRDVPEVPSSNTTDATLPALMASPGHSLEAASLSPLQQFASMEVAPSTSAPYPRLPPFDLDFRRPPITATAAVADTQDMLPPFNSNTPLHSDCMFNEEPSRASGSLSHPFFTQWNIPSSDMISDPWSFYWENLPDKPSTEIRSSPVPKPLSILAEMVPSPLLPWQLYTSPVSSPSPPHNSQLTHLANSPPVSHPPIKHSLSPPLPPLPRVPKPRCHPLPRPPLRKGLPRCPPPPRISAPLPSPPKPSHGHCRRRPTRFSSPHPHIQPLPQQETIPLRLQPPPPQPSPVFILNILEELPFTD